MLARRMNRSKRSTASLEKASAGSRSPRATKKAAGERRRSASSAGANATYVYCVVKSARAPKLGRAPAGLDGAEKTRLLDAGDGYHLVVTSAPLAHYDAAVIDAKLRDLDWVGGRAAEHEAVVEHAAGLGTVVPMKLFTLFSTDERALDHVRKMKDSPDRVVERIAGCEEWGLRILFDEARAARAAAEEARAKKVVSGTGFLLRRRRSTTSGAVSARAARRRSTIFTSASPRLSEARTAARRRTASSPRACSSTPCSSSRARR